jgi:hypothetical protein
MANSKFLVKTIYYVMQERTVKLRGYTNIIWNWVIIKEIGFYFGLLNGFSWGLST